MPVRFDKLMPLKGWFEVTRSKPDMITFDNEPDTDRAEMFCGHVISPTSMKDYYFNEVSNGKLSINCPSYGCNAEWPFFVVKEVLKVSSTHEEMIEIGSKLNENYIYKLKNVEQCPKCHSYLEKPLSSSVCVECPVCKTNGFHDNAFCWYCKNPWMSHPHDENCGNVGCDELGRKLKILAECEEKTIMNRSTPSIRGCPKCGLMIEYKACCTQMCCVGCRCYFCFFCLDTAATKRGLKCIPNNSNCQIAPRQTTLPGL